MNDVEYKKLSLLIQKYCPDFAVDQYPKFIAFLKAYYDWSANVKEFNPWRVVSHLVEWGDIDETLDKFIVYFKNEYLNGINLDYGGNIQEFIKHSKEFYSSRGTPESFRFLLQLLTGNSGEIFYPNQFLMKSSDGEWVKDYNIFVENSDLIDNSFISTLVTGKESGATAIIESIETHFNYQNGERFLKIRISNIKGEFADTAMIFDNGNIRLELPSYKTINNVVIENAGNNYKPGDTLSITGDPTFICRVQDVYAGKIDSYAILDGGTGYSVGDVIHTKCDSLADYSANARVYVDEVDPDTGAITSLDIRYPGYGFLELPTVDYIESATHLVNNKMVPPEYTPIDYIENSGTNYLDLGITLTQDNSVELKFEVIPSANPDIIRGLFGGEYVNNNRAYTFSYKEESSLMYAAYGNSVYSFSADLTKPHIIKREKRRLYLDKTIVYENPDLTFDTLNPVSLFATTASGSHNIGISKIYFCRIYDENGYLIGNYVPVRRESDNKIGIYETINGEFITNESGTDFTGGSDSIIMEDATIEFISSGCGAISEVGVVSAEINYVDDTPLVITSSTGSGAIAKIKTGEVFTTIPYYYKPGSFLSDEFKLQDSDYWQEYSYEIRSSLVLDSGISATFTEYKDVFKQLVHPAGFKVFNSFVLSNHISLDMLYINSTIQVKGSPTFIDFVNWIEMISYWDRIIDTDIIWQHRITPISEYIDLPINTFKRTGGSFVHSSIYADDNPVYLCAWEHPIYAEIYTLEPIVKVGDITYNCTGSQLSSAFNVSQVDTINDTITVNNRVYTRSAIKDLRFDSRYQDFNGMNFIDVSNDSSVVIGNISTLTPYRNQYKTYGTSIGIKYDEENRVAVCDKTYTQTASDWAIFYTDYKKQTVAACFKAIDFLTGNSVAFTQIGSGIQSRYMPGYAYFPLLGETEADARLCYAYNTIYALYLQV